MTIQHKKYQAITVFCSASWSAASVYTSYMRRLGEVLAEKGITVVFGGGDEGLMGCLLQGVLKENGDVRGIITDKLFEIECHHPEVYKEGQLIKVGSMAERKQKMFELGDAILVGPGGWGTIDEISEYAVSVQIGDQKRKPMIFLNFNDFWKPMKDMILNMLQDGTFNQDKVDFIEFSDSIEEIFEDLNRVQARIDANRKSKKINACAPVK